MFIIVKFPYDMGFSLLKYQRQNNQPSMRPITIKFRERNNLPAILLQRILKFDYEFLIVIANYNFIENCRLPVLKKSASQTFFYLEQNPSK